MILYTDKHKIPFQIDDEDYDKVWFHCWCISGYPITKIDDQTVALHQLIMGKASKGLQWDHINQDKMDNRKQNLRLVTQNINQRNVGLRHDNKSGVKGVTWNKRLKQWFVHIYVSNKEIYLGIFHTLEEATEARRKAEDLYWGNER